MLERIYAQIPAFVCKTGCHECCGPLVWSKEEHERISSWLIAQGRELLRAKGLTCPYVGDGGCTIYEVRPLLCRLYGTIQQMKCPRGCQPKHFLSDEAARAIMHEYVESLAVSI